MKLFHHRLLLVFLVLQMVHFLGGLGRLALGHPAPEIGGGKPSRLVEPGCAFRT